MTQIGGEQQQPVLARSEHSPRDSGIAVRNCHHVAEVIVWSLKLQLPTGIIWFRADIEHSAELSIAVAMGLNRPALLRTDHRPSLLDVNLQSVIGPKQFHQECIHVDSQLLVQPLECIQAMQLIQACFAR